MINQEIINIKELEGATVAVTGLYDKGKTFVLNSLTMSNLPSGKKVITRGISFKHVNVDNGNILILVDTAGTYKSCKNLKRNCLLQTKKLQKHLYWIQYLIWQITFYMLSMILQVFIKDIQIDQVVICNKVQIKNLERLLLFIT